jgi:hypothetical protein
MSALRQNRTFQTAHHADAHLMAAMGEASLIANSRKYRTG